VSFEDAQGNIRWGIIRESLRGSKTSSLPKGKKRSKEGGGKKKNSGEVGKGQVNRFSIRNDATKRHLSTILRQGGSGGQREPPKGGAGLGGKKAEHNF